MAVCAPPWPVPTIRTSASCAGPSAIWSCLMIGCTGLSGGPHDSHKWGGSVVRYTILRPPRHLRGGVSAAAATRKVVHLSPAGAGAVTPRIAPSIILLWLAQHLSVAARRRGIPVVPSRATCGATGDRGPYRYMRAKVSTLWGRPREATWTPGLCDARCRTVPPDGRDWAHPAKSTDPPHRLSATGTRAGDRLDMQADLRCRNTDLR